MHVRLTSAAVILTAISLWIFICPATEALASGLDFRIVALSGAAGPIPGTVFGNLHAPVLNDKGEWALKLHLAPDKFGSSGLSGIFFGQPGEFQLVAADNQAPPDFGDRMYYISSPIHLNDKGEIAFSGLVRDGIETYQMRWAGRPGQLKSLYPRFNFGFFLVNQPRLDFTLGPAGDVAYQAFLPSGGGATGIYAGSPGNIQLIVQGLSTNSATFDFDSAGALITSTPTGVSYRKPGETGWTIGSNIPQPDGLIFRGAYDGRINDRQEVAFLGALQSNSSSFDVWIRRNGQHQRVTDGGSYIDLRLAESGDVAYRVGTEFPLQTSEIRAGGVGTQRVVARVGQQAPGLEPATTISTLSHFALNNAGLVALAANLEGPGITSINNFGIFAEPVPGVLVDVVRTGEQVELSPNTLKTIGRIEWVAPVIGEHSAGWNARNELAVHVLFNEGGEAILLYNVPEPSSIALGVVAVLMAVGWWRRRACIR